MVRSVRRLAAGSLVVAAVLAAQPVSSSVAGPPDEDLHGRKHTVERRIAGASRDLDESSAQLRHAADGLLRARVRLSTAQQRLAGTRAQLALAQRRDDRLAASLTVAVGRLARARERLAGARQQLTDHQDALGALAASTYQNGDPSLLGLSMVLTSQDPAALTGQLNAVDNVMDKQSAVLAGLEASRAVLTVEEREVARARGEVARQRRAAAATLAAKRLLEQQAATGKAAVQRLVAVRASARRQAERARAADRAQLARLEHERHRIVAVLARRAVAARVRAAAARARAAAAGRTAGGPVDAGGVLTRPVAGPVTSPFGWRVHPIFGYRSLHDGIDLGAACGTPIHAAAAGQVLEEYASSAWGNRLVIDHGLHAGVQLATISNHLSGYAVGVGARVARGQVVGYVGTTGWSTGCHLHFTVLRDGVAVDPQNWF